jgi:hypothetical protein
VEIDRVARIILTVRDRERSRPFDEKLLPMLGMTRIVNSRDYLYFVASRPALGLRPDADGIRFEVNFVPGKGVFEAEVCSNKPCNGWSNRRRASPGANVPTSRTFARLVQHGSRARTWRSAEQPHMLSA